jgi:transketolase
MTAIMKSTRDAYGEALLELGEKNTDIVVLDADLSSSTRTSLFASRFPERFFDLGVAEQNLYGVAAGLAVSGKIPFASTFAVFSTERAFNQIKQNIAYPALNVRIAPSHSGFSASGDGGSHQSLIDVSLMRSLPNMTVIVPADATQTRKAVQAAMGIHGPVYLRLGKSDVPVLFDEQWEFQLGRVATLREGADVTVFVTGILLGEAYAAAEILAREDLGVQLVNVHTIKPIDRKGIVQAVIKTGCAVTVEEHSVIGGLGSAVAEVLACEQPVPLEMVGVKDCFGESGTQKELFAKHGLTPEGIARAVHKVLDRRLAVHRGRS